MPFPYNFEDISFPYHWQKYAISISFKTSGLFQFHFRDFGYSYVMFKP